MTENGTTREIVESVVGAIFDAESVRLREEIVRRVMEQLGPGGRSAAGESGATALLEQAAANIEQAGNQSDILAALLAGTAAFAPRAAVFLLRNGSAVGWQARGFEDLEGLKLMVVGTGAGLAQQALDQRASISGKAGEFDARFAARPEAPFDGNCLLTPLSVRDKAVALVYADAGTEPGGTLDRYALQLLIRMAGIWLELLALRKAAGTPANGPQAETSEALSAAAPVPETAVPSVQAPEAPPQSAAPVPPPGDEELHRKARRFAKLLVEEIKLYNLPKVRDGKLHRNLYDRLKDDIEKSRATYDQRYANTPVASADYFTQELVRGLADGDAGLFGSNFPR